jgi:hypothetical protein
MPDFVQPSRLGQAYSGSYGNDADALFLKVFSGEIITTFEKYNVMMPLHRVRTIQSGKSATFPVTGVAGAKYHVPGESVLSEATGTSGFASGVSGGATYGSPIAFDTGASPTSKYLQRFKHNEKVIFIDDVLVSSVFVADIDEMKNHYDVRSIYSTEIGRALAYTADKNLIRSVIAGARKTTDRFGASGSDAAGYLGARVRVGLDATTSGSELLDSFFVAAQKMDEANVPSDDRFAILPPSEYYKMVNSTSDAINRDYAGEGSVAAGEIIRCAGIRIMKSNHVPTANESSNQDVLHGASGIKNDLSGADTGYSGLNYSTTKGIIFHREALGTVKLMDLSVESEYVMERLGTLMLAKYAMGHNVLREECCYELYAEA